jgi:hypothetical protein
MAYLRTKQRGDRAYHYLVKGIRSGDGKVRQKVLKYYGTKAPGNKQLEADILELGTTKAFDINMKVTKASLKAIIGTIWRNKHTHEAAKIAVIQRNLHRGDFEVYDGMEAEEVDPTLRCPMTWVNYGEKWSNSLEHWYRVDNLTKTEKLEGYRKRVGYCRERVTDRRKAYNEMKTKPVSERGSCHTANTNARKREWKEAEQDLEEAIRLLEEFEGSEIRRGDNEAAN